MVKVDYEQAIKKPFTDLVKLIIGSVLSIIPIVHWLAQGFIIESSGLGKTKPSKKMPEFKDWGYLFIKGLWSDIILLIYAIPAMLVFLVAAGSFIGSITGDSEIMTQIISQNWYLALPSILELAPLMLLGFILLLAAFYLTPVAVLSYLKTKKFGEAFNFSKISKRAFTADYFVIWLIALILTGIITFVLSLIPVIGPRIAFFITGVMSYSLYGQIFRKMK